MGLRDAMRGNAARPSSVIALALLCTVASAQEPPIEASLDNPADVAFTECWFRGKEAGTAEAQSDQAFRECQASILPEIQRQRAATRSAEEEMASAYQALHRKLEAGGQVYAAIQPKVLLDDQRLWSRYRVSHCWLDMQRASGGNWRLTYRFSKCVEDEARKRTGYLRGFLQGLNR